jgi:hypothetical protein
MRVILAEEINEVGCGWRRMNERRMADGGGRRKKEKDTREGRVVGVKVEVDGMGWDGC